MKIAVIADIHGNAPALEAVLSDVSRHHVDRIVQLGDAFNGPIDPGRVAERLMAQPMIHLRGNGERMIVAESVTERSRSTEFARIRLSGQQLAWIRDWPALHREQDFLACHGSPQSDLEYLLEEITSEAVRLRTIPEIQARLGQVQTSLVLCAHSHIPRLVRVSDATLILNPGSVGLPAYSDKVPVPHTMEVGSPCARYAIAERCSSGWHVTHLAVPYDHENAAAAAEKEGFSQWARALRTGYAR